MLKQPHHNGVTMLMEFITVTEYPKLTCVFGEHFPTVLTYVFRIPHHQVEELEEIFMTDTDNLAAPTEGTLEYNLLRLYIVLTLKNEQTLRSFTTLTSLISTIKREQKDAGTNTIIATSVNTVENIIRTAQTHEGEQIITRDYQVIPGDSKEGKKLVKKYEAHLQLWVGDPYSNPAVHRFHEDFSLTPLIK